MFARLAVASVPGASVAIYNHHSLISSYIVRLVVDDAALQVVPAVVSHHHLQSYLLLLHLNI